MNKLISNSDNIPFQPNDQTSQIINQLVIRSRFDNQLVPFQIHSNGSSIQNQTSSSSQGLQTFFFIKLSIPFSLISSTGSSNLTLPLMPDRHLRLNHSTVFPLSRRSYHSKPILQSCQSNSPHAQLAASILNLSRSFRVQNQSSHQPPPIRVVIRNFNISLVIPTSLFQSVAPNPTSPVAEYAVVLDCLSLWSTTGPDWPFSIILPTPPCLKNSFRLYLPTGSNKEIEPSQFRLTTYPPLRRERLHPSPLPHNIPESTPSSVPLDEDLRPLSDESEPEGIASLPDDDDEPNHDPCSNWPQDERSPHIDGVFQSTKELCIMLNVDRNAEISPLDNPITTKSASTRLSVSIQPSLSESDTKSLSVSIQLNFHVDLEHIGTQSTHHRTPFVLTIPQHVTHRIISARWSPLDTESLVHTSFPTLPLGQEDHFLASSLPLNTDQPSPTSSNSSVDLTLIPDVDLNIPDLELINTAAPFPEVKSETHINTLVNQPNPDAKLDDDTTSSKELIPYQFVAWFDTEWLIRSAATSHNQSNSRLEFNLHGQLDLAITPSSPNSDLSSLSFPIPFFILPSVGEQICTCQISYAPADPTSHQQLNLDLPSWANLLESSSDQLSHRLQFHLNSHTHTPTMDSIIIAHLYQSESSLTAVAGVVTPERKTVQPLRTVFQPSLPESNVSIGTLIISPAGRIRYHSRRSTMSNGSYNRKRPRHSLSIKNKPVKFITIEDEIKPDLTTGTSSKTIASIRSVQLDLVIAGSSSSELPLTQYGEFAITVPRSIKPIVDPWISLTFPTKPDDTLEIIGVWIGDRELDRNEGFELSEKMESGHGTEEFLRLIIIKLNEADIHISGKLDNSQPLPIIRMIVKSVPSHFIPKTEPLNSNPDFQNRATEYFPCLLPSFDSSVGTYKVSLRTCVNFEISVDRSNMFILENSPKVVELVQYSLPPNTLNQTYASIKPTTSSSGVNTWKASSSVQSLDHELDDEQTPENENHPIVRKVENMMDDHTGTGKLEWIEKWTHTCRLNFKTLLLCWLIYLISSMSIQLDEMSARLDTIDNELSQQNLANQAFHPGLEFKQNSNDAKEEPFGNSLKPSISHLIPSTFKPSSLIFKHLLSTSGNDNQMIQSNRILLKETEMKKTQIQDNSPLESISNLKEKELESNSPTCFNHQHDQDQHSSSNAQRSGEIDHEDYYYLINLYHRFLTRPILDPFIRFLKKTLFTLAKMFAYGGM